MILVDTSAWVEFLRDTRSRACVRVDELLDAEIATSHPIRPTTKTLPCSTACRRGGETVRRLIDCLIAATAIRTGVSVLHADTDFDRLARLTSLRVDIS